MRKYTMIALGAAPMNGFLDKGSTPLASVQKPTPSIFSLRKRNPTMGKFPNTIQGRKGTLIDGMEYTPAPKKGWTKNANKYNRRKTLVPREMYCTDIKVKAYYIENLSINAWNHLVNNLEKIIPNDDALKDYRAKELKRLLSEYGKNGKSSRDWSNKPWITFASTKTVERL